MLILFFLISLLFLFKSRNLLLSLLLLEILSFVVIYEIVYPLSLIHSSDFYLIVLFSIFVIEGVIGLSGLISLVSFTGSDYISSSSILNL